MHRSTLICAGLAALLLGGCAAPLRALTGKEPKRPIHIELEAVGGSRVSGALDVTAVPGGVRIQGLITGLIPGSLHGVHIHERGDCTAPNSGSAGGHFNPRGRDHGDPAALVHHAGDIANQFADAQGNIHMDVTETGLSLDSGLSDDVLGRSLMVLAGQDDYTTQPDGGGGAAIACGVILKGK
ncbi:MAG: superoxide dismutase family protein [Proteobacteria bacterium]|nr:superoxide dismutase family protein [Pseudomonadota bacterium]